MRGIMPHNGIEHLVVCLSQYLLQCKCIEVYILHDGSLRVCLVKDHEPP